MAVAIASKGTFTSASGTSLAVDAPSGIQTGDLLLGVFALYQDDAITVPTGWTQIDTLDRPTYGRQTTAYKTAVLADESAVNYTFTQAGSAEMMGGYIFRITGQDDSTPIGASSIKANTSTNQAPATTITPGPSSMLFYAINAFSGSSTSAGSYAIVTSNPTWTEEIDTSTGGNEILFAIASATRPEATATGAGSALLSATRESVVSLISIDIESDIVANADVVNITGTALTPTIAASSTVTADVTSATLTALDPTVATTIVSWDNDALPPETVWVIENQ